MVRINWSEELTNSTPRGEFDLRFCSDGKKYMKYIMTYILWIDATITSSNTYYRIRKSSSDEFEVNCTFECDEITLKKIHNRFRNLVRKHWRSKDE